MSRKYASSLPVLMQLVSRLPWWLSVVLAVGSGWYLHSVAVGPVPVTALHLDELLVASAFKGMARFGQFVVPALFIGGAVASVLARRKRRRLLDSITTPGGNTLVSISWQEFELLVGEALRRKGFSVQEAGGAGPDGGIDLVARKDGEKYLVQCKQWRAVQVGVSVVRELYGVMAAEGAVGGFVITSGRFTKPATEFAAGRNVQLVDGILLNRWITEASQSVASTEPQARVVVDVPQPIVVPEPVATPKVNVAPAPVPEKHIEPQAPACPHCKKVMVMKVARTGPNAGGNFWGCGDYPKCRGIRAMFAPMKIKS